MHGGLHSLDSLRTNRLIGTERPVQRGTHVLSFLFSPATTYQRIVCTDLLHRPFITHKGTPTRIQYQSEGD